MIDVKVPMRDGVELNATIYHPSDHTGSHPTVFIFTPYVADTYHDRGRYFAQNGFNVAIIDVRGRGSSGGVFEPFADLRADGHDAGWRRLLALQERQAQAYLDALDRAGMPEHRARAYAAIHRPLAALV